MDRHTTFSTTTYFASLDGLRALSILPVVWHHATPRPLEGALGRGPLGVELFFAISGFLITTLLLRERQASGTIALGSFYARRSLRIFPLYYLVLGLFVLHAVVIRAPGPIRDHFFASLPFHATYTSNWFVDWSAPHPIVFAFGWSLATEEQFYLVWPFVVRARRLLVPVLFMAGLVVLDQVAEAGALPIRGLALAMVRSFATPIGLGSLVALGLHSPATFRLLDAFLGHRFASLAMLVAVVLAAAFAWPLFVTHLAMVALVVAVSLREDHVLAPWLRAAPMKHLGRVSYGMYLFNVPAIMLARHFVARTIAVFVVGLVLTVAWATLAHRFVEGPFFALRARFRSPSLRAR